MTGLPVLLTAAQNRQADEYAIKSGITGEILMENAGGAVANWVIQYYPPAPTVVVCGAGNNGGDGFVIARLLQSRGWPIKTTLLGEESHVKGDAAIALAKWKKEGVLTPYDPALFDESELIIDTIFGTGLSRAPEGMEAKAIEAINASKKTVIAVDMPSGVLADDGTTPGIAINATATITFFCAKPGQLLLPGKTNVGTLAVEDIGIPLAALDEITPFFYRNLPALWDMYFSLYSMEIHKYQRGHALIVGGGKETTGAARMTAMAAARIGAGLVSVACDDESLPIYAASLTSVMTKPANTLEELQKLIDEPRITSLVIGPGAGLSEETKSKTLALITTGKPCVLDADALSVFKEDRKLLLQALGEHCVLTPHEGEFSRLFDYTGDKLTRARLAARESNAIIVLKGSDTVIAAPNGAAVINDNAPAWLSTAGAGDVLAGIIAGLMAQNVPPFSAACAGVWLHGKAASTFGRGMIAEDIINALPFALQSLEDSSGSE